jgi:16S rRNA (adenine1518-N6/adenine1519-N6)-dimethyltransferase
MSTPDALPPLREVIRRHGLAARKSLGQNFLLDLNLTGRIARAAGPLEGVTVVEIGPGPGGLTRALLAAGAQQVIAIERDERAMAALSEIAEHYRGRLAVVAARRRPPRPHRRQSALQYRHRPAGALARGRALAALVRPPGADVPA